jgi:hypothetical protein
VKTNVRKVLFYLLMNFLISACATTGVLFVYDQYYRSSTLPGANLVNDQTPVIVEIVAVVGAGIPTSEMVLIRNAGKSAVPLNGWQLQDADGNQYTFGAIFLPPGSAIQLHTTPGENTLIDLFWGLSASTWTSGETATLLDAAGMVRSVYKVP